MATARKDNSQSVSTEDSGPDPTEILREDIERILDEYGAKRKYMLARKLAEVLELMDTIGLEGKIEEVLGRILAERDRSKVASLKLILRDNDMFKHGSPSEDYGAKVGL